MFKKISNLISDPTQRLLWMRRLANTIIILVAGASTLVLLFILFLNLVVVPRVSDWRVDLERICSDSLGSDIRIGQIEVDSTHLIPSFKLSEINIQSLNERSELETLSLPVVYFDLSFGSLLSLSFDQIVLDNPLISVIKNADGRLRVAGLSATPGGSGKGLDWFFSQPNIQINHATALWIDEALTKEREAVQFSDVNFYFNNRLKAHDIKLEITPPQSLGDRFSVQGHFKESIFSTHTSNFKEWSGTAQFNLPQVDLVLANEYLPVHPNWSLLDGKGWLRVWVNIHRGLIDQITSDVNFPNFIASWSTKNSSIEKIRLKELSGRLQFIIKGNTYEAKAQDLTFVSEDESRWKLGQGSFAWTPFLDLIKDSAPNSSTTLMSHLPMQAPGKGILEVDQISIKPLLNQFNNFTVESEVARNLKNIELAGDLQNFKMNWDFDGQKISAYTLDGQLKHFLFKRMENVDENFLKGIPGLENADIQFNIKNTGGKASLNIDEGSISLNNWLEEPLVPLNHANADIEWTIDERAINLKINKTNLINADARGDFELNSFIPRGEQAKQAGSTPIIDLSVNLQKGEASQVYRYLPKKINPRIREYLHKAISHGLVKNGTIKIKGPLNKFPFVEPSDGEFHIAAHAEDLTYQYAPTEGIDSKGLVSKAWPELTHLNAELIIDRKSLFVKKASTKLSALLAPTLEWSEVSADIGDLFKPIVNVKAKGKGPLAEVLKVIANSTLNDLLGNSLSKAESTPGVSADYLLTLSVPLNDLMHTKVTGNIGFANNDISFLPGLPSLNKVRGSLIFDEAGISLTGVKARIFGSEAKIDGGLRFINDKTESIKNDLPSIKIQGVLSAEALRQSKDIVTVTRAAQYLSGQANYLAALSFNKGQLDFELNSTLQGLSCQLPTPFAKNVDSVLPLKISSGVMPQQTIALKNNPPSGALASRLIKTNITLGQIASVAVLTDLTTSVVKNNSGNSSPAANFNKVWIGINPAGSLSPPSILDSGYMVSVDVSKLDADVWEKVLTNIIYSPEVAKASKKENTTSKTASIVGPNAPLGFKIKTGELIFTGRSIHQVVLDGNFQDVQPSGQWHLNISSNEAKGAIEYRLGSSGVAPKVFARMGHLVIPPTAIDSVESLLSNKESVMPALDIVVDDLEVKGKKLGHAEIEALNQSPADGGREWRINKLNLTVPEGKFQATGAWAFVKDSTKNQNTKKTTLDFYLDVDNAGQLLDRMGTKGAVSGGKGRLSGQVSWLGSPMQMDYASLGGHFNVNIEKGSFLKTEPGAGRLLGVLNLQALPRRLLLDFKDIFSDGFSFDFFRGDVNVESGIAKTNNLQMKGVNAAIFMEGRADISNETQNLKVIVIPEIDAGTASLVVAAINPVIGISTYLAQYFLKKPISQATTKDFLIEGTWSDPKVTKINAKQDTKQENKNK